MDLEIDIISSGIVTFRLTSDDLVEVLTLNHTSHISHPKGHVESGEELAQAAIRELKEETDLEVIVMSIDPIYSGNYEYEFEGKSVSKLVHYFAGIVHRDEQVRISGEHQGFQWKDVRAAKRFITHNNDVQALDDAVNWLIENHSAPIITARRLSLL